MLLRRSIVLLIVLTILCPCFAVFAHGEQERFDSGIDVILLLERSHYLGNFERTSVLQSGVKASAKPNELSPMDLEAEAARQIAQYCQLGGSSLSILSFGTVYDKSKPGPLSFEARRFPMDGGFSDLSSEGSASDLERFLTQDMDIRKGDQLESVCNDIGQAMMEARLLIEQRQQAMPNRRFAVVLMSGGEIDFRYALARARELSNAKDPDNDPAVIRYRQESQSLADQTIKFFQSAKTKLYCIGLDTQIPADTKSNDPSNRRQDLSDWARGTAGQARVCRDDKQMAEAIWSYFQMIGETNFAEITANEDGSKGYTVDNPAEETRLVIASGDGSGFSMSDLQLVPPEGSPIPLDNSDPRASVLNCGASYFVRVPNPGQGGWTVRSEFGTDFQVQALNRTDVTLSLSFVDPPEGGEFLRKKPYQFTIEHRFRGEPMPIGQNHSFSAMNDGVISLEWAITEEERQRGIASGWATFDKAGVYPFGISYTEDDVPKAASNALWINVINQQIELTDAGNRRQERELGAMSSRFWPSQLFSINRSLPPLGESFDVGQLFSDPDGDTLRFAAELTPRSLGNVFIDENHMLHMEVSRAGIGELIITAGTDDPERPTTALTVKLNYRFDPLWVLLCVLLIMLSLLFWLMRSIWYWLTHKPFIANTMIWAMVTDQIGVTHNVFLDLYQPKWSRNKNRREKSRLWIDENTDPVQLRCGKRWLGKTRPGDWRGAFATVRIISKGVGFVKVENASLAAPVVLVKYKDVGGKSRKLKLAFGEDPAQPIITKGNWKILLRLLS